MAPSSHVSGEVTVGTRCPRLPKAAKVWHPTRMQLSESLGREWQSGAGLYKLIALLKWSVMSETKLHIEVFTLGDWMTNCFVVVPQQEGEGEGADSSSSKPCWLVDVGFAPDAMIDYVKLVPLSEDLRATLEAPYTGDRDKLIAGYWEPYSYAFHDNVTDTLWHREYLTLNSIINSVSPYTMPAAL